MRGVLPSDASRNNVHVLRNVKSGQGETKQVMIPVPYQDIVKGKNLEANIILKAGDVIVVRDGGLRGREAVLALFTVIIIEGLMGVAVSAQTRPRPFIPTLTVSETYDSNVFNTPKTTLPPGSKPEDYITTVTPMINMARTGSPISGNLSGGALVTRYLENKDLIIQATMRLVG